MTYLMNPAQDAYEFIKKLSPTQGWFPHTKPDISSVYRGHADGAWQLLPSALRSAGPLNDLIPSWVVGNLTVPRPVEGDTYSAQVTREYLSLLRFFEDANSHALPLPDYSQIKAFFDSTFPWGLTAFQSGQQSWPPDVLLPLMALGQHYALPTRLLDWTVNPYFAAYFAAKGAAASCGKDPDKYQGIHSWEESPEQFFVVWGLNTAAVRIRLIQQSSSRPNVPCPDAKLRIVNAPAAVIPNLAAQKGLFTLYESGNEQENGSPIERQCLTTIQRDLFPDLGTLCALTCPIREARRVLYLLAIHGISAATVYPGYRGVVTSIEERQLWDPVPRHSPYCVELSQNPSVGDGPHLFGRSNGGESLV